MILTVAEMLEERLTNVFAERQDHKNMIGLNPKTACLGGVRLYWKDALYHQEGLLCECSREQSIEIIAKALEMTAEFKRSNKEIKPIIHPKRKPYPNQDRRAAKMLKRDVPVAPTPTSFGRSTLGRAA